MGMTSLKLVERVMYSASVVGITVIICILEAHVMGAPAKCTSQPKRDLEVIRSMWRHAVTNFLQSQCPPNNQNATAHQGGLLTLCLWRTRGIA